MTDLKLPSDFELTGSLLANRTVLVTGAGDGIGRALALACANEGAEVVLLDRVVRKLEAVYDAICAAGAKEPAIYPLDLEGAVPDHYLELAETIEASCGGLDTVIHNAARLGPLTPLEHYDPLEWAKVLQINLYAPFLLSRACLPLLRAHGDGRMLFMSDAVGSKGRAYWGAYCVSKFGLRGLMELVADEEETEGRIKICSVDPGPVATMLRANAYPAENRDTLRTPAAITPALIYLLANAPSFHGQHVRIADETPANAATES